MSPSSSGIASGVDASTARRATARAPDWRQIERENPGLSIGSVRRLGEGWISVAYVVNDQLVIKLPKGAEPWEELEREAAFLARTAGALPLAVPHYVRLSPDSRAAEHGYAIYAYLRGEALDVNALSGHARGAAAAAIAGFLRALHGLRPTAELGARLPRDDPKAVAEEYFAKANRHIIPELTAPERGVLAERLESQMAESTRRSPSEAVLHADLSADHILVREGEVTGVIDFGDVSWGDPDYDFTYLFVDAGGAFVEEVARRYEHPDIARLMQKVGHFALVDQIDTIVHGPGWALDGQIDAAWRRLRAMLGAGTPP
jgi:aminoglycoside 2''-phosphotransferase